MGKTTKASRDPATSGVAIRISGRRLAQIEAASVERQAETDERSRRFDLLDAVSTAKGSLEGTVKVMQLILDAGQGCEDAVAATLTRWVHADTEAFDLAFNAAWDGLLKAGGEAQ